MEKQSYFIIDGNNLAHRMHSVHFDFKKANGDPSGMFFGFIRMIVSLKKKFRNFKFVTVWDNRAVWKYEIQPDYKAGRTRLSSDVYSQMDDIKKFLLSCGVDQYEKKGEEADDIIASLVEKFRSISDKIYIYTNDKDMLQLVEDGKVIVFKPKGSTSPEKYYDEEAVKEQFGVSASKLACFRSFVGDASDAIVGLKRVRKKTIAGLVNKRASVDEIYENLASEKLTDHEKNSFLTNHARVKNNFKIVKLKRDIDLIICSSASFDKEKSADLLKEYEIKSMKADDIIDLFESKLNVRYTDPSSEIKIESFSLFD